MEQGNKTILRTKFENNFPKVKNELLKEII